MTRIVTTHYRYKPPPRKRKTVPLAEAKPTDTKKPEPPAGVVRKAWRR
jgi:hypothetical protein